MINQYQYTVLQKYTQNKQLLQDIIIHMQQQHIMHTIISIVLHNNNMVVMLIHTMQLGMQRNNNILRQHTIIINNNSVLHHVMMMGTRKPHRVPVPPPKQVIHKSKAVARHHQNTMDMPRRNITIGQRQHIINIGLQQPHSNSICMDISNIKHRQQQQLRLRTLHMLLVSIII